MIPPPTDAPSRALNVSSLSLAGSLCLGLVLGCATNEGKGAAIVAGGGARAGGEQGALIDADSSSSKATPTTQGRRKPT